MKVIGLTGGIGSGKSTVSQFLAELGAIIIDADKVGHQALKAGSETWHQVVSAFGEQMLAANGDIDRTRLGEVVFNNTDARERLNRIIHPRIHQIVQAQLEEYRRQGVGVVVIEAPLLLEAGWKPDVDEVWVTTADENTILKRLRERSGLSGKEALARIRSQLSSEERVKHADVIIETDCTLGEIRARVERLWEERRA
ncbi:dephospho-CoA kinase [Chloroflexota bacterium]